MGFEDAESKFAFTICAANVAEELPLLRDEVVSGLSKTSPLLRDDAASGPSSLAIQASAPPFLTR